MALSKEYLVYKTRKENPFLKDAPDEQVYYYGLQQSPNVDIEPWDVNTLKQQNQSQVQQNELDTTPAFFDHLDYGTDENSWYWRKKAYNDSLTGMSEQLLTGKKRFNLDDYDPHIAEDIVATAMGFFMPLDLITMWAGGGFAAKGYGAVAPLVTKQMSKKAATKFATIEGLEKSAPIAASMLQSAGSLGAYEGAIGYVNAKNQGEDEFSAIGSGIKGVLHGSAMGAMVGGISKGFAGKHQELMQKELKGALTTGERVTKAVTSKPGAYVAEVGSFQGVSTAEHLIKEGHLPDADQFLYELTFNAGLIGALKTSQIGLQKGKTYIADKRNRKKLADLGLENDTIKEVKKNIDKQLEDGQIDIETHKKMSEPLQELLDSQSKAYSQSTLGVNGVLYFLDKVLPNLRKSKRADQQTAQNIKDAKVGIKAEIELIEQIKEKYNIEKGTATESEAKIIDRRIKEAEGILKELREHEANIDAGVYTKSDKKVKVTVPLGRKKIIEKANEYGLDVTDLFSNEKVGGKDKWSKQERIEATEKIYEFEKQSASKDKSIENLQKDKKGRDVDLKGTNVVSAEEFSRRKSKIKDPKQKADVENRIKVISSIDKKIEADTGNFKEGSKESTSYSFNKNIIRDIIQNIIPTLKGKQTVRGGAYLDLKTSSSYANELNSFSKWVADKGISFKELKRHHIESYMAEKPTHERTIKELNDYLKSNKISDNTVTRNDIGSMATKYIGESPKGIRVEGETYKITEDGISYMQPKSNKPIIKYITDKTKELITSLRKTVKGKFLFKNTKGRPLMNDQLNGFVDFILGNKNVIEGGKAVKARLIRRSLISWASNKYGKGEKGKSIMELLKQEVLGDRANQDIILKSYDKSEWRDTAVGFVKKYIAEIEAGGRNIKSKAFYNTKEISNAFKEIKKLKDGDTIKFKDTKGKDHTITKETAETLLHYLIEANPRINEVVPSSAKKAEYQRKAGKGDPITQTFLNEMQSKNPGLGKIIFDYIDKNVGNKKYAGRFINGAIELIKGNATIHTFFHENGHRLKTFLKEIGDTKSIKLIERAEKSFANWAKKNDTKKWNEYYMKKYKTEAKAREEYFLDRMADVATKRQTQKGLVNRLKQHGELIFSKIKNFLGLGNKKDIARIYGEQVFKGFSTEGVKLKGIEFKQTEAVKRDKINLRKDIKTSLDALNMPLNNVKLVAERLGIELPEGKLNLSKITDRDILQNISDTLKYIVPSKGKLKYRSKDILSLMIDVAAINRKKGIAPELFSNTLKALGVKDGKMQNASKEALMDYFHITKERFKDAPKKENTQDLLIVDGNKQEAFKALPLLKRAWMPTTRVLRKYGGKVGGIIADKIDKHTILEERYLGYADSRLKNEVRSMYKSNKEYLNDLNRYWMIDKERLKDIQKNHSEKLSSKDKAFLENLKDKNSREYKGTQVFKDIMQYYWKQIEKEASRWNNKAEMAELKARFSKSFVQDYFTRRVSDKAFKIITNNKDVLKQNQYYDKSLKEAAINKVKKDSKNQKLSKEEIAIRAEELIAKNKNGFVENFLNDMYNSLIYSYSKVNNPHLLKRNFYLGEYIVDPVTGKKVKAYETNFGETGNRYIRKMSQYLPSVRHFVEWTDVGGKHTVPRAKASIMLGLKKDNLLGQYMETAVHRTIGLTDRRLDSSVVGTLQKFGRWSAVAGLSSPMSGIKNIHLAVAQIYGNTDLRSTVHGLSKIFNREADLYAREVGAITTQRKYMELNTWQEKIFRFNLMSKTENWARIASIYAKKMYNEGLINQLRNERQGIFSERSNKIARDKLRESINDTQIDFLINYEPVKANKMAKNMYLDIHTKLDQLAHKKLQGGTSVGEMPLWASSQIAKPFTLFQRMAYAATWNSYRHYLRPIRKHGNFMPLVRYGAASYLSGASLYYMYDKLLGIEPPKTQDDDKVLNNVMMNLWKAETLGLFTEAINLYSGYSPNMIPLQTPVIVRHAQNAGKHTLKWYHGDKTFNMAATDFIKEYAVVVGQAEKFLQNSTQPYTRDVRRINTLKRVFMEEQGLTQPKSERYGFNRLPFYTKFRADFSKGGDTMYRSYFSAYNYIVTDLLKEAQVDNPSRSQAAYAHKKAVSILRGIVTRMNPNNLSKEVGVREVSIRDEFNNWLKPENKQMLKRLEKEYGFKVRQLNRQISKHYKKSNVLPYLVKFPK